MPSATLSHLEALESEAVHILREVAACASRPALLFSGGKDSAVCLHLAQKAFWPARVPFVALHIDTGHNFPEVLRFRDEVTARAGVELVVARVQDDIDAGRVAEEPGGIRNRLQTVTLLRAISEGGFDAAVGGARRDEEGSRAKERVFSHRDRQGRWDPRNQRPELWDIYNSLRHPGEHLRVFPLSNWTESDVWHYIAEEGVELPSLYFAHSRPVLERSGMLLPVSDLLRPQPGEQVRTETVRFRTVGDATCTGCVVSQAATPAEVAAEVDASRISERGATRLDDRFSEAGMEDRKRQGYF